MSEITLLNDPNFVVGCYSMDLYCKYANDAHRCDEFPHQYTAETSGGCRKQARRAGWMLHPNNTATCPKCARIVRGG